MNSLEPSPLEPSPFDPHGLTIRAKSLVFEDPLSRALLSEIRRFAPSNATVLVTGETGTGKEIVARYIHELSRQSNGPFVAVNCGSLSDTLIDSELFGHEKGSFTGALTSKVGWFEAAQGGTLFLDEVGDLPLNVQVKLLRVLQEREVVRLGSRQARPVDMRLVAATNIDLEQAVRAGQFREDLYFRLNVAAFKLPSLRERPRDILPLTEHFLRVYAERAGHPEISLTSDAIQSLLDHAWPGNVRELENVIQRAVLTCLRGRIEPHDLRFSAATGTSSIRPHADPSLQGQKLDMLENVLIEQFQQGGPDIYSRVESTLILSAYQFCHNNQIQTAQLLGISRNVLRARLAKLGVIAGRAANVQREEERTQESEPPVASDDFSSTKSQTSGLAYFRPPRSLPYGGC